MQVTDIKVEGLAHHFKITIPAKDIQKQVDQKLEELTKTLRIDGFRPGKVPLSVVQKRYGDAVYAEAVEKYLRDSLPEAMKQKNIKPATQPKIDVDKMVPGQDLEIKISVEAMPDIKPVDLKSISLVQHKIKANPKEVEETLESLRKNASTTKVIKTKRACKKGDVVVIDFVGRTNGEIFEGGSAKDFKLELGSKSMIEGFEDQIVGMKVGDKKNILVTFPDDYHKPLAGKKAEFEIALKEIQEKIPAEMNDEFAKTIGKNTIDELRQEIKNMVESNYDEQSRQYTKRCLFDLLYEQHNFPVPQELLEQEFKVIWNQFEHEREHGHIDDDDKNKPEQELKKNYHHIAERRVRLGLLLAEIGRMNNIEVQNDDIRAYLERESKKRPQYVNEILKLLRENPAVVEDLKGQLFEDKVVDFILEKVKRTEKAISLEDFQKVVAQKETSVDEKKKIAKKTQPASITKVKTTTKTQSSKSKAKTTSPKAPKKKK